MSLREKARNVLFHVSSIIGIVAVGLCLLAVAGFAGTRACSCTIYKVFDIENDYEGKFLKLGVDYIDDPIDGMPIDEREYAEFESMDSVPWHRAWDGKFRAYLSAPHDADIFQTSKCYSLRGIEIVHGLVGGFFKASPDLSDKYIGSVKEIPCQ
ncbi:MAG: hypothetical protein ACOZBH_03965 [Patescibacteria group bacterium]